MEGTRATKVKKREHIVVQGLTWEPEEMCDGCP